MEGWKGEDPKSHDKEAGDKLGISHLDAKAPLKTQLFRSRSAVSRESCAMICPTTVSGNISMSLLDGCPERSQQEELSQTNPPGPVHQKQRVCPEALTRPALLRGGAFFVQKTS